MRFIQESECELIVRLVVPIVGLGRWFALDPKGVPEDKGVTASQVPWFERIVDHAFLTGCVRLEEELLVVILLSLVDIEVGAVEVEQAVGQPVASQTPKNEV